MLTAMKDMHNRLPPQRTDYSSQNPMPDRDHLHAAPHKASRIITWNGLAIPWIVRDEPYTRALLTYRPLPHESPELAATAQHVEIEAILDDPNREIVALVGHAALQHMCGPDTALLAGQLRHLIKLMFKPADIGIHIVVPNANVSGVANLGPVTLYENHQKAPTAEEETWSNGRISIPADRIADVRWAVDALFGQALSVEESRRYIQASLAELEED